MSEPTAATSIAEQLTCILVDESINSDEVAQLEQLLATDASLCNTYVKQLQLHAFLSFRSGAISPLSH